MGVNSMMKLSEAAQALGVASPAKDAGFTAVSTDSRAIKAGELFLALKGERFDGHAYVADVLQKGAAGAIVEAAFARSHPGQPLIGVADTRLALGDLAAHWRQRFAIPVIGVVGSNGKTTAKEMCAAILRAHFGVEQVLATTGNLNNDIGLPTMALRLRGQHRAAVLEIGMNHPGETTQLAGIAQATVALVNNAQREHQEFMQSVRAVAEEHAILIGALPVGGVAVYNADDEHAPLWLLRAGARQALGFGLTHGEVRGEFVPQVLGGTLSLDTPWGGITTELKVPGEHNARNACGAAAACLAAGVSLDAVAQGLTDFGGVKGRLQQRHGRAGARLIDDSYNANPDSMRAALEVLVQLPGHRIFIMGDMGEVGDNSLQMHEEVGAYARTLGVDRLLALGEAARSAVHSFGSAAQHFERLEDLIATAEQELGANTTFLVKGSRFMRMERVADALTETPHAA
jgi:UDP-N-acetylmuramoyl-tripeptide--D-alanyl-D-alanine ligase